MAIIGHAHLRVRKKEIVVRRGKKRRTNLMKIECVFAAANIIPKFKETTKGDGLKKKKMML